jgi:hypothetical protein
VPKLCCGRRFFRGSVVAQSEGINTKDTKATDEM